MGKPLQIRKNKSIVGPMSISTEANNMIVQKTFKFLYNRRKGQL